MDQLLLWAMGKPGINIEAKIQAAAGRAYQAGLYTGLFMGLFFGILLGWWIWGVRRD